jgi:4-amino-4-deoxy-L-arabinose transferase-like glycosyltransferase
MSRTSIAIGVIVTWTAVLIALTWLHWPDVLVDFGREAYVPWRLLEGDVLYRDIAWLNGPISPYLNALWFRVFGVHLHVLFAANLAVLLVLAWLVSLAARALSSAEVAIAVVLLMLALFGFAQPIGIGNYNFISPYSHEATHGLLFGGLALFWLTRWARTGRAHLLFLCGVATGAAILTKPEFALATTTSVAMGMATRPRSPHSPPAWRSVVLLIAAVTAPPVIALALLGQAMPLSEAALALAGPFRYASDPRLLSLPFYRRGMGLDDPGSSLLGLASALLVWVILARLISRIARRREGAPGRERILRAVFAALFLSVLFWLRKPLLLLLPRPLPLLLVGLLVLSLRRWRRSRGSGDWLLAVLCLFALAAMAKLGLNARLYHYGFALALPATMVAATLLLDVLPRVLADRGSDPRLVRLLAGAVLAVMAVAQLEQTLRLQANQRVVVGAGADRFLADARGILVNAVRDDLRRCAGPESSLLVVPEGVVVNYLERLRNPTPYVTFMPPEIIAFGEDRILAAMQRARPDFVLVIHKDTTEYGLPLFGRDYARSLMAWVRADYLPMRTFGAPPLVDPAQFGMALLHRRDHLPACR